MKHKVFLVYLFCQIILLVIPDKEGYCQIMHSYHYGSLKIKIDPRLDTLIMVQTQLNDLIPRYIQGYRVQVISTTNRNEALEAQANMLSTFPDYRSNLIYENPYFKVRIGDFQNQNEADSLKSQIIKTYPSGVFIVPDRVRVNKN